jgi:hypothetical protein
MTRSPAKTRKCPPGKIYRKGFYRKYSNTVKREGYVVQRQGKAVRVYPKGDAQYVGSVCVEGTEPVGTPKSARPGELKAYGYVYRLQTDYRHKALDSAAKVYGAGKVYRKLRYVADHFRKSKPEAAKVFAEDRDWFAKKYGSAATK